jgi:Ca-activated chloride channel family protein
MKKNRLKPLGLLAALIAVTAAALGLEGRGGPRALPPEPPTAAGSGGIALSARLVQQAVLKGTAGRVSLALTLSADPGAAGPAPEGRGIDLVVVLDRSGSMEGPKIAYARQALLKLLSEMAPQDRFALLTYADGVETPVPLLAAEGADRRRMLAAVEAVRAGGATNLGAGLQAGIDLLAAAGSGARPGRILLVSDGLANRGVTDPQALARMASAAAERTLAVSTVGVGADFHELLMTAIADRGAGSYTYLENPSAFAEAFRREFLFASAAAATGIVVSVDLPPDVALLDAAGYPVATDGRRAFFPAGAIGRGQTRQLFLTFRVPTDREAEFALGRIAASFHAGGRPAEVRLATPLTVACVADETRAHASIDRGLWEKKVLIEDYNRLKEEVAADIRFGRREQARKRVTSYCAEQGRVNAFMHSDIVAQNIEKEVKALEERVDEAFAAPPAAASPAAKSLQFEGYSGRRGQ